MLEELLRQYAKALNEMANLLPMFMSVARYITPAMEGIGEPVNHTHVCYQEDEDTHTCEIVIEYTNGELKAKITVKRGSR